MSICSNNEISDDDILIRRVPPPIEENTTATDDGGRRPNSNRMQKRSAEDSGLSCSVISVTSPEQLLSHLEKTGLDRTGWGVCGFAVSSVKKLGLEVILKPEDGDNGHCEVQGAFGKKTPKKLAQIARMLSNDEINTASYPDGLQEL